MKKVLLNITTLESHLYELSLDIDDNANEKECLAAAINAFDKRLILNNLVIRLLNRTRAFFKTTVENKAYADHLIPCPVCNKITSVLDTDCITCGAPKRNVVERKIRDEIKQTKEYEEKVKIISDDMLSGIMDHIATRIEASTSELARSSLKQQKLCTETSGPNILMVY